MRYDLVLRNGTLIDGTGGRRFSADVGVVGEHIARIGDLAGVEADRSIDVAGLVVAPGFIDVHTHDDAALIARPEMTPKLTQGVTSVIAGNCGIGAAPYSGSGDPPGLLRLVFKSARYTATDFGSYVDKVAAAAPGVNAGFLTGHATLRMEVMGERLDREASPSEIEAMRSLLTQCLRAGSLGLSTGLFYPPARAATTREIIELAQPLREHDGLYVTHLRDEADEIVGSLNEALRIGRESGAAVIISHHKCMGRKNFGRSAETLPLLREASRNQPVSQDLYPYTAGSSILQEELVAQSLRTQISWCDPYPQYSGRDLQDVAREMGCSVSEAIARLQPAGGIYFLMDEADVVRIMNAPLTMIGSDGLPEDAHPHPRLWGTFPRVLGHYVRERGVLSLEDAVFRMTGLSAARFGLEGRGLVKVGHYADLCVFDPATVLDTATFEHPSRSAQGICHVVVNGRLALEHGVPTQVRAGKILRRL